MVGDVLEYRLQYFLILDYSYIHEGKRYYNVVELKTGRSYYLLLDFLDECVRYSSEDYSVLPKNIRDQIFSYI